VLEGYYLVLKPLHAPDVTPVPSNLFVLSATKDQTFITLEIIKQTYYFYQITSMQYTIVMIKIKKDLP